MSSLLVSVLFSASMIQQQSTTGNSASWEVDRQTVTVGGCLTLTIRHPGGGPQARNMMLRVANGEPTKMLMVGPAATRDDETHILLWANANDPQFAKPVADEPNRFQIAPIFSEPGALALTVELPDGRTLGSRTVTVVRGAQDYAPIVELLTFDSKRDAGNPVSPVVLWMRALASSVAPGSTDPFDAQQLAELQALADTFAAHPDWSEVARLVVAAQQAGTNFRAALAESARAHGEPAPWEVAAVPEAPPDLLNMEPKSRFAAALREEIRMVQERTAQTRAMTARAASQPVGKGPSSKPVREDPVRKLEDAKSAWAREEYAVAEQLAQEVLKHPQATDEQKRQAQLILDRVAQDRAAESRSAAPASQPAAPPASQPSAPPASAPSPPPP